MNKQELANAIAKETGESQAKAAAFIDAFISTSKKSLAGKKNIQLIGFGSFTVKKRSATTGRNPRTGETIKIPAKNVVKFTPGKDLKDAVS